MAMARRAERQAAPWPQKFRWHRNDFRERDQQHRVNPAVQYTDAFEQHPLRPSMRRHDRRVERRRGPAHRPVAGIDSSISADSCTIGATAPR